MHRFLFGFLALLLAGCGLSDDQKAAKLAVERAAAAFERNIPEGAQIEYGRFKIVGLNNGAVCGTAKIDGGPEERFWAGGTDQGEVTPILERWEDDPAENDALFADYCKGKDVIAGFSPKLGEGKLEAGD